MTVGLPPANIDVAGAPAITIGAAGVIVANNLYSITTPLAAKGH